MPVCALEYFASGLDVVSMVLHHRRDQCGSVAPWYVPKPILSVSWPRARQGERKESREGWVMHRGDGELVGRARLTYEGATNQVFRVRVNARIA